jgi:hypothetical protein
MSRAEFRIEVPSELSLSAASSRLLSRTVAAVRNAPLALVELNVARGVVAITARHGDRQHMILLGHDAGAGCLVLRIEPLATDAMRTALMASMPPGMLAGGVLGWYVMSPSLLAIPMGLILGTGLSGAGAYGLFEYMRKSGRLPESLLERLRTSVEVVEVGLRVALEPVGMKLTRVDRVDLGAWDAGAVVRLRDGTITDAALASGDASVWTRFWLQEAEDVALSH